MTTPLAAPPSAPQVALRVLGTGLTFFLLGGVLALLVVRARKEDERPAASRRWLRSAPVTSVRV